MADVTLHRYEPVHWCSLLTGNHITVDGGWKCVGAMLVWEPVTDGMRPRTGVIVSVEASGALTVMWNPWTRDDGELGFRTRHGGQLVKGRPRRP